MCVNSRLSMALLVKIEETGKASKTWLALLKSCLKKSCVCVLLKFRLRSLNFSKKDEMSILPNKHVWPKTKFNT